MGRAAARALVLHPPEINRRRWRRLWPRYEAAFSRRGIEADDAAFDRVILYPEMVVSGRRLSDYRLVFFRNIGPWEEHAHLIAAAAARLRVPVFDRCWADGNPVRDRKSVEWLRLAEAGIAYPRTIWGSPAAAAARIPKDFEFPVILKETDEKKGRGTYYCRHPQDVAEFLTKPRRRRGGILIQEFVPNDGDVRVLVVGGRPLGACQRGPKVYGRTLRRSTGTARRADADSAAAERLAAAAAAAMGVDIAGVDLVRDRRTGQYVVLEVNRSPQFDVFERAAGVDAVEEIVQFFIDTTVKKSKR